MPTRRAIVLGTIATGIAVRTGRALAKASQPATPVNFDVPAGACDCHTHIFSEPEKVQMTFKAQSSGSNFVL